jgi:hypothetical protein
MHRLVNRTREVLVVDGVTIPLVTVWTGLEQGFKCVISDVHY